MVAIRSPLKFWKLLRFSNAIASNWKGRMKKHLGRHIYKSRETGGSIKRVHQTYVSLFWDLIGLQEKHCLYCFKNPLTNLSRQICFHSYEIYICILQWFRNHSLLLAIKYTVCAFVVRYILLGGAFYEMLIQLLPWFPSTIQKKIFKSDQNSSAGSPPCFIWLSLSQIWGDLKTSKSHFCKSGDLSAALF